MLAGITRAGIERRLDQSRTAGARRDRIDSSGVITLRYDSQLRHIGLGREHARTRVLALVADRYVRIVDAETGDLLRELTLDPTKD